MNKELEIQSIENRILLLSSKKGVSNTRIIAKLQRRLRKLADT